MLDLDSILSKIIPASTKGVPALLSDEASSVSVSNVGSLGWNLLAEDLPFPVAIIRESRLRNNLSWMEQFISEHGVCLAPHGKTTMSPQLFDRQLRHGAWGITVANMQQVKVCREFGVPRIFLANQLANNDDVRYVARELQNDSCFEFYCLVDSVESIRRLDQAVEIAGGHAISVLVEVGMMHGRTGCRSVEAASKVAREVAGCRNVVLRGVECYEGISITEDDERDTRKVRNLLSLLESSYQYCMDKNWFDKSKPVIVSAGGSAFLDIVANHLPSFVQKDTMVLLRSGCYLTHDSLFYQRLASRMTKRSPGQPSGLKPALEIWGCIQSVPEPGLAILNVGKRDVSHDIDMPIIEKWFRPGRMANPQQVSNGLVINALNDHHAYVACSAGHDLAVGDLLSLGISHPCTTFDKWQLIWIVDDEYRITSGVWTFF